jgi:hypothetical protein
MPTGPHVLFSLEHGLNKAQLISFRALRNFHAERARGTPQPWLRLARLNLNAIISEEENVMKKTLAVLATIGVVGAAAVTAPAPAEAHRIGPGLAFGLAAGAITAGAIAATSPYYYGPGYYGYYGPGYGYAPGPYAYYGPGPDVYYGGPIYYHRHRHFYGY